MLAGSVQPDQMSLLGGAELGRFAPQSAFCFGDLHALPRPHPDEVRLEFGDHGQHVAAAPALLDFAGAVQVAQIRRTRTVNGKKSVEVVYVITSMPTTAASPVQIAAWVQGHWSIEVRHEVAL